MTLPIDKSVVIVRPDVSIAETIKRIASGDAAIFGLAVVVDVDNRLLGMINNGDIIRLVAAGSDLSGPVSSVMIKDPITVVPDLSREEIIAEVLSQVRSRPRLVSESVAHVLVVGGDGQLSGVLDFNKLLAENGNGSETVAVYGLGYVGLTLAVALASRGHVVTGYDVNRDLIAKLNSGAVHVFEPSLEDMMLACLERGTLEFKHSDDREHHGISIIAVGTPVNDEGTADLAALLSVTKAIGGNLQAGDLVLLRSTVPVGTTRSVVGPMLEELSGLVAGNDFHLAFTPERTVEGQAMRELRTLPQVVGGLSNKCAQNAAEFWNTLTNAVVHVDGLEAAELVKLANNSFRDLSFAFSNALALLSDRYNVDAFQLISSANEGYPRNAIPLPSPGVGGYCLTKDPHLFAAVAPDMEHATLARSGRQANRSAGHYPVVAFNRWISRNGLNAKGLRVLIVGFAFKGLPETNDLRGSTALEVARALIEDGVQVSGWDAVVEPQSLIDLGVEPATPQSDLSNVDAVLILNNHPSNVPTGFLAKLKRPALVFDGWSLLSPMQVEQYPGLTYATMGYMTPVSEG